MVGEGVQGIGRAGETMGNKAAAISEKIFAQKNVRPSATKCKQKPKTDFGRR